MQTNERIQTMMSVPQTIMQQSSNERFLPHDAHLRDTVSVITSLDEQLSRTRQVPRPESAVVTSLMETGSSLFRAPSSEQNSPIPSLRVCVTCRAPLTLFPFLLRRQRTLHLRRPLLFQPTSQLITLLRPCAFFIPTPHRPPTKSSFPWPSVPTQSPQ